VRSERIVFRHIGYSSVRFKYKIEKSKHVTKTTRRRWKTIKQTAGVCSDDARLIILGAHWFIRGFFGDGNVDGKGGWRPERKRPQGRVWDFDLKLYYTERWRTVVCDTLKNRTSPIMPAMRATGDSTVEHSSAEPSASRAAVSSVLLISPSRQYGSL